MLQRMTLSADKKHQGVLDESASPASTPPSFESGSRGDKPQQELPATHQEADKPAVPLGGRRAWLQVLGGFFAFINIW